MSLKKMITMRASHILVESYDEAISLLGEIQSGRDFSELARQSSSCPSKTRGGDLAIFSLARSA